MSLSDNLRRLARERIPTAPAKWLGPITPTVYTNDSTLILPTGVNKAKALAVLTEALGLNLLQVAAIGDAAKASYEACSEAW
jgi:hydroxymethylpyrimidine pyrophosphatase-like HAD family hydrolase